MKIELKNIKYSAFASEETHCYEAALYVDGKPLAIVRNDGHGGADYVDQHPKFKGNFNAQWADLELWLRENGNHSTYGDGEILYEDAEMRCCHLINEWHRDNEVKKILRRISYIKNDAVYQLPAKHKPTPEALAKVKEASWWEDDFVMLSGQSVDDAKTYLDCIGFFGG